MLFRSVRLRDAGDLVQIVEGVGGGVPLRVGDGRAAADAVVRERRIVIQRVGDFCQQRIRAEDVR